MNLYIFPQRVFLLEKKKTSHSMYFDRVSPLQNPPQSSSPPHSPNFVFFFFLSWKQK